MASERQLQTVALAMALALVAVAHPAAADPTSDERGRARVLMDQGDVAFEARHYDKALEAYQAAHALMRVPSTGLWLAKAQAALGRLVEARETALEVTRMPKRRGEHPVMETSRNEAAELARTLASRIPTLRVLVQGAEDGAPVEVRVDDAPWNEASTPQSLDPGTHAVTATAPGRAAASTRVTITEGESATVNLQLRPPEAASRASTSVPRSDGGAASSQGLPTLAWVGFGVGAAGLVAGGITGLVALSRANSAKERCQGTACDPAAGSDIDAANTLGWVSTAAFALGAAGIVVGAVALGTRTSGEPAPVTAIVSPGRVALRGSF